MAGRNLLILGDAAVHRLLINLGRPDILRFHDKLANSLASLSHGQENLYQPAQAYLTRPEGQKILFRPFTSPNSIGTKIITNARPNKAAPNERLTPQGILTLCDADGVATGVINAKEVTGYRTTMSAMVPYLWRRDTSHIVIFGAGLQALWHARLALALRGPEIKSITLVNRSLKTAQAVVAQVQEENATRWKSAAKLDCLDPSHKDYDTKLRSALQRAGAIFCTVPSTAPLFPAKYVSEIVGNEPGARGPFISCIGSWQPKMIEIDPELVTLAARASSHIGFFDQKASGGAIVVDDVPGCKDHAGEVVQSGLAEDQLIALGDLVHQKKERQLTSDMQAWMAEGYLVYKSIGVSVTDLVAGESMLEMAQEKQEGTIVPDF